VLQVCCSISFGAGNAGVPICVLQCVAGVLQSVSVLLVCSSMSQCIAVCPSQSVSVLLVCSSMSQCIAVCPSLLETPAFQSACCSVLQGVTGCCRVLQGVAVC